MGTNNDKRELFFEERNTSGVISIIFLHSAGSCCLEWDPVISNVALATYHSILVDLPHHSGSRALAPFALDTAADAIAEIIRKYAHGKQAHVVGMSLGGFVALKLTARHPEVISSCFVSGAMPYEGIFRWFAQRPRLLFFISSVQRVIPGWNRLEERVQGFVLSDELKEEFARNRSKALTAEAFNSISNDFSWDTVRQVASSNVRTCAVAGAKMDQVDSVKKMGHILHDGGKRNGINNVAAVVEEAVHFWSLQLPDLFAAGVHAWINSKQLPQNFKEL